MITYIESKNNKILKYINNLLSSKSFRKEKKEFVVEGVRLCYDALLSNCEIKILICTENALNKYESILSELKKKSPKIYILKEDLFSYISNTKSPQGVMCICSFLDKHFSIDKIINNKLIAFENIQDPANLGTMFRTAEAFGINSIILSDDCCDVYNPKVLRGSMGAVFRLNFYFVSNLDKEILKLNTLGYKTYAAVPDHNADKVTDVDLYGKCMMIIGNEGNGLKNSTKKACTKEITIPMPGKAESLNAAMAAGILMWELLKGGK